MAEPFVGEIIMFGGNFPPRGWATCDGQLMPISQNTALFSLLGTFYGGNGTSTFALPNLRDASPLHQGQGPGLSVRNVGETGGTAAVALTGNQIPSHTHQLSAGAVPTTGSPDSTVLLAASSGPAVYGGASNPVAMAPAAISIAGGGQAHENRQPYLAVTFVIALQGVYPARN